MATAAIGVARGEATIPDAPEGWVTDHVGFLSPAVRNEIDGRLAAYARTSGHQVIVYVGLTTRGAPLEDWTVKAFQRWRVGRKGIDDGLALFIFSVDRRVRIEVGYGLEPIMTDARASLIIRNVIVPRLAERDRDGAVRAGVDAILDTLAGATTPPASARLPVHSRFSAKDKQTLWIVALGFLAIPALLLLLFGLVLIFPRLAPLRRTGASGQQRNGWNDEGSGGSESSAGPGDGGGFSGGGGGSGGGGASGSW